uniref:Ig-like domain-containing protein n=1 Tax=Varanus komodoensis TaxID=61221 RepID=A0A8D2L8I4_VARKO
FSKKPSISIFLSISTLLKLPSMGAPDGGELTVTCKHASASPGDSIHWYQQFSNQPPQFIISGFRSISTSDILEGVSLTMAEDHKSSILHFSRVTLKDSAVYFYVLSDTVLCPGGSAVQKPFFSP